MNLYANTVSRKDNTLPVSTLSRSQYVLTIAEESGKVITKRHGTISKTKGKMFSPMNENIFLPMNGMQAGIYVVELETSEGTHSVRVIKY